MKKSYYTAISVLVFGLIFAGSIFLYFSRKGGSQYEYIGESQALHTPESPLEDTEVLSGQRRYAVAPHHLLTQKKLSEFYDMLSRSSPDVRNIVIISPNHFAVGDEKVQGIPENGASYCFRKSDNCLAGAAFDFLADTPTELAQKEEESAETYMLRDHGVGEHFAFIRKYFSENIQVYPLLLNIELSESEASRRLISDIESYDFPPGETLILASVDFSHHVPETVARFHDMRSVASLSEPEFAPVEVDCPNCLYVVKSLAQRDGNPYFQLFARTSSDTIMQKNMLYDNTSHIFGLFQQEPLQNESILLDGVGEVTEFETYQDNTENESGEVYGIFFGDTHFTRGFTQKDNSYTQESYLQCFYQNADTSRPLKYWHNRMLFGFDFAGVNLETSLAGDSCQSSQKEIVFNTQGKYLDLLQEVGVNLYNLANNHSYDCGNMGYEATKQELESRNLGYFGEGRGDESYILLREVRGVKVAFMGVNDTTYSWDMADKLSKIQGLKEQGYLVVLNIHWGMEYKQTSSQRQRRLAREFVDAGVNLIVGHHPHVTQEHEVYKGVPIVYSVGNFLFDQPFEDTLEGHALVYALSESGVKFDILSFRRDPKTYMIDCQSFE